MKNKILAIEAAPEAIPPKPKIAAMIATIRKITVQRNIVFEFRLKNKFCKFFQWNIKFCATNTNGGKYFYILSRWVLFYCRYLPYLSRKYVE